jgi:general secretion pathway protein D
MLRLPLLLSLILSVALCGVGLSQYTDVSEMKVTVRLQNADLHSAIQALIDQTGAQICFEPSDREYGKVNVSLVDQPIEVAIQYICRSAGAGYRLEPGGVYVISPLNPVLESVEPAENSAPEIEEPVVEPPLITTKIYTRTAHPKDILNALFCQEQDAFDNTTEMLRFMWTDRPPYSQPVRTPIYAGVPVGGQPLGSVILPENGNVPTGADRSAGVSAVLGTQIRGGTGGTRGGLGGQLGGPGGQLGGQAGGAAGQQEISGGLIPDTITLISYDPTDNSIVVQGTEEDIEELRRYITMFDVRPKQVMVKVEFVTVTTDRSESFGIDWLYQRVNFSAGNTPGTFAVTNDPIFVNFASGNVVTRLRARLIGSEGYIVNAPLVTTLNNQPAMVGSSTTMGLILNQVIVTGQGQVVTAPTLTPIYISSNLSIAPRVNRDGTITISVAPMIREMGQIRKGPNGEDLPDIIEQYVQVSRIIRDGETMVLGGLTRKQNSMTYQRFPILGDLPIIGQFFRSRTKVINESELLIFITPSVIPEEEEAEFGLGL